MGKSFNIKPRTPGGKNRYQVVPAPIQVIPAEVDLAQVIPTQKYMNDFKGEEQ